jgi:TatD DNase family protein
MEAFADDRLDVLARAARSGVSLFITVPARNGDGPACAALARSDPRIYATAGLHPHEAREWDDAVRARLEAALGFDRIVAVGEIGLDFHYDLSPRPEQERAFRDQIGIARGFRRPLVIHTRSAPARTLEILKEEGARETGGVVHCFTEDTATARGVLDLGLFVSFSGIVTFPKATSLQEAARFVPADRMLVETDAPFLAPIPHRGKRNEPAFVAETLRFLARLRGEDAEALARTTFANCRKVFSIPSLP